MQDKIKENQQNFSSMIPELAHMAADLVRDLDPQVLTSRARSCRRCACIACCVSTKCWQIVWWLPSTTLLCDALLAHLKACAKCAVHTDNFPTSDVVGL